MQAAGPSASLKYRRCGRVRPRARSWTLIAPGAVLPEHKTYCVHPWLLWGAYCNGYGANHTLADVAYFAPG